MASPKAGEISAAELEIKRRGRLRLIGAITIGLLAIVFLPMIFDSEPERNKSKIKPGSQEISIQIPPKEGLPPLPAPAPVPTPASSTAPVAAAEPAPNPAVASVAPPAVLKTPAQVEITKDDKKDEKKPDSVPQVAKVSPTPASSPSPKPAAKAIEPKQGFVVQIGAFKDAENAKQIIAQAKVAKLPVYTDSIAISGGTVTRVRVGPFATKQKADSALAQLKLSGSDGKIVPLP